MKSIYSLRKHHCQILIGSLLICASLIAPAKTFALSEEADAFLISKTLQKTLLKPDWKAVINAIPEDSTVTNDPRVMLLLGHALYGLGQNNAAAAIFMAVSDSASLSNWQQWTAEFAGKNQNSSVAHYLYGDALARNARFDAALNELATAIKLDEKLCLAWNARGAVYDIKGNLSKASDDFEVVATHCADFADVYASIGVVYLQRGLPGAGEQFVEAIRLDSTHAMAYNGRACYFASKGDIEKAKKTIIQANENLEGNPYIVTNARAFTDPTDSTSTLAKIANVKNLDNVRGAYDMVKVSTGNLGLSVNFGDILKFDFQTPTVSASTQLLEGPVGDLRGGVYFKIIQGDNLKTANAEFQQKVATDFTLGYPRIHEKNISTK